MENAVVDPQTLMRLVAKNAKRGAQFTPQGLLKYPLVATRPDEVLLEIHEVLAKLAPADAAFLVDPAKRVTIAFDDAIRSRFASGALILSSP